MTSAGGQCTPGAQAICKQVFSDQALTCVLSMGCDLCDDFALQRIAGS